MPTHGSQIERAISHLNESAYGTPRANSAVFRRIISRTRSIASLGTNFENDAGYDNGSDVASDTWATTVTAGVPFNPDFCFEDVGYFLKDALGAYAVSGSGPYVHTFTPQDMSTSRQMPSRTYLEKAGGLYLRLLESIVLTNLTLSGGKLGRLSIDATYEGSGKYSVNPAGYSSPAITDDREYGYASQVSTLSLDDGTTTHSPSCDLETWELVFNNPPADDGYRICSAYVIADEPTSGQVRSEFLVGARSLMFNFSARLAASDPLRGWMQNGTELELAIEITGTGTSQLVLTHDRAKLENVQENPDVGGGFIGITGSANLLSTSGVFGFEAELTNGIASYNA